MKSPIKHIKRKIIQTVVPLLGLLCTCCIQTYDFESEIETVQRALVIEATLTNELKTQEILLSRTNRLGEAGGLSESNAQVRIIDNKNTKYLFEESDSAGVYLSAQPFAALKDHTYRLSIITNNGDAYSSQSTELTPNTKMDRLYAARDFNEDGLEGISIYVDSYDPTGNSKYYRHEYEETYKIIAPFWTDKDIITTEGISYDFVEEGYPVTLVDRAREEQICYKTNMSNSIKIVSSIDLDEDRLDKYRIRFISRENYIISHRYSILIKQYVQSRESQLYYERLKLFSQAESLFSENQPGFFEGNVFAVNDNKEKVLGYFEVCSVDIQRIYFNYDDFFTDEELPPYANGCLFEAPPLYNPYPSGSKFPLLESVKPRDYKYYMPHIPESIFEGPALLVTRSCGDCTVLGQSEAPEFWVE